MSSKNKNQFLLLILTILNLSKILKIGEHLINEKQW